eukprot:m.118226 g.118226  ORF g.118226 m.118226 type:complete len:842 (+) comp16421_c0_seq2:441-2966(+)
MGDKGKEGGGGKAAALVFERVNMVVRGVPSHGPLKVAPEGFAHRSARTKHVHSVSRDELRKARWMRVARGYELRFVTSTGNLARFDGFSKDDWDKLGPFFAEHYPKLKIDLRTVPAVKGSNVGTYAFEHANVAFLVDGSPAFEIPLNAVSNAMFQKTDAMLEFHLNDDAPDDAQQLESVRFFIPGEASADIPDDKPPVQTFVDKVLAKAEVIKITGDAIAKFPEMPCVTPRGRYEIALHPNVLQLHSKSYTYKISYSTIIRLWLLPKPDQRHVYFVVNVDPPLRQGQTRYPFFVFQFPKEEEASVEVNTQAAPEKLEQLEDEIKDGVMEGPTYVLVSALFKALAKKKVAVPGRFQSKHALQAVKCAHKGADGFLYPLEKAFMFVHKPVFYLKFDDVAGVTFTRVHGVMHSASQTFDLQVEMKSGAKYEFSAINRDEFENLSRYIENKRLRITNVKGAQEYVQPDQFQLSDEEDDRYVGQLEQELSDSDSSDEDFQAPEESSDPEEEFDSDKNSDEDGDAEKPATMKKKKKKSSSVAAVGDDEETPRSTPKKKKKKPKDPNAPKKPSNGYMMYANSVRGQLMSDNPTLKVGDIAKLTSTTWHELGEAGQAEWKAKSKEALAEWKVASAKYREEHPELNESDGSDESDDDNSGKKKKKKGAKRIVDPNAPKKPLTPFFQWLADNRAKIKSDNPELKNAEVTTEAGRLWRELDPEAKAVYEKRYAEQKEEHTREVAKYHEENPEAAAELAARKASKPKKSAAKKKSASAGSKRKRKEEDNSKQSTIKFKSAETINSSEDDEPLTVPAASKPAKAKKKAKAKKVKQEDVDDDGASGDADDMHTSD